MLAIVTGASSGIGAAAARQLGKDGYKVVLVARSKSQLEIVAGQIGPHAFAEVCDASNGEEVLALAERINHSHGVPDVIVNCAGAGSWKAIEDTSPTEAAQMMQAPFFAAFNITSAFMRGMLERRRGVVIHINSPGSICPWPASVGYASSRWALRGLHEALCQDLKGTGVQSCQIVFGKVAGGYFEHNLVDELSVPRVSRIVRTLPLSECGELISLVARRPRRQTFHPLMLRVLVFTHSILPVFTRMLSLARKLA